MAKKFQTEISFSMNEEDKKLYDKYGVPATELANDGEFFAAARLIDKILKENQNIEFALILKANYLFNHISENLNFDEVTPDNIDEIKQQAEEFKKQFEECVNLIDKALSINPKNDGAKGLKEFIERNSLKEINTLLNSIENIKDLSKITKQKSINAKLSCPHCGFENFEVVISKTEDEYQCPKCRTNIKAIIGRVRAREGKFRTVGYGSTPYTIRLITLEGEEKAIFFTSDWKFEVRSGDEIALLYKKGWLSNRYSDKPCGIINWTIGTYFDQI